MKRNKKYFYWKSKENTFICYICGENILFTYYVIIIILDEEKNIYPTRFLNLLRKFLLADSISNLRCT